MDRQQIISGLADRSHLHWSLLSKCLKSPDACVPLFLLLLERKARGLPIAEDEDRALYFGLHLLAALRVKETFDPISLLFSLPTEAVAHFAGDAISDTIPQVLMAVSAGKMDDIWKAATSHDRDWLVRDAFLRAWTYGVLSGALSRDAASTALKAYPEEAALDPDDFLWTSWFTAIADLGLSDLAPLVEEAVRMQRMKLGAMAVLPSDLEEFHQNLETAKTVTGDAEGFRSWSQSNRYTPFAGTYEDFVRAGRHVLENTNDQTFGRHLLAAEPPRSDGDR